MNHDNFTEVTSEDAPKEFFYTSNPQWAWARGYNTCLERTNAAELLECLHLALEDGLFTSPEVVKRITNAIKKTTDESR